MKTRVEIKNWILKNCVDNDGDIDLSSLNFSDFDGDIYRGLWKVKGDLYETKNEVKGSLYHSHNKIGGNSYQEQNEVKGKTYNDFDNHNKVMRLDGEQIWVEDERFKRKLEDMTKEELIEMIRDMEK